MRLEGKVNMPDKKKRFVELPKVTEFIEAQTEDVQTEYREIVGKLETEGRLVMPFGEKVEGENLFAIRVIQAGNIRVFYVYGNGDRVYGIYGYVKKTQAIPSHELKHAKRICQALKQGGYIK